MLRLTRLHLILLVLGLALAGYGLYTWLNSQPPTPTPLTNSQPEKPASDDPSLISKPMITPKMPARSKPLGAATPPLASAPGLEETYEVVRGDTLWRIAAVHSPIHQGPGWVTIWRANQRTIKNFNRIEVGSTLHIPGEPRRYVMAYWQPRQLHTAGRSASSSAQIVDRRRFPRELELALLTSQSIPADLERALGTKPPTAAAELPRDVELALLQSEPFPKELELALAGPAPDDRIQVALGHYDPPPNLPFAMLADYRTLVPLSLSHPSWPPADYH